MLFLILFWLAGVAATILLVLIGSTGTIAAIVCGIFYIAIHAGAYVLSWLAIPVSDLGTTDMPTAGPNPLADPGENRWRAFTVGLNAALAGLLASILWNLFFLPVPIGSILGLWVFVIISLAAAPLVANLRAYQVLLGYTAWLSPPSMALNLLGLLLFLINLPFAIFGVGFTPPPVTAPAPIPRGIGPVRIDFTAGVIETDGGLIVTFNNSVAFSVGSFTFLDTGFPGNFVLTAPSTPAGSTTSAHEVGHSLSYAAFGPLRWIEAMIDQSLFGNSFTALTELGADSRARTSGRFQLNLWS